MLRRAPCALVTLERLLTEVKVSPVFIADDGQLTA